MYKPLVSIIIPVYNGSNYLKEAIDSALSQTYPNIEVIVINDGSNDNGETEKIALSYGNKIRYFYKKNGGVATALNLAIKNMRGEYFSWLSHDDMYYTNKIEKQMRALYEDGNMTKIVWSDYDLLDVNSQNVTRVAHNKVYSINQLTNSVFPVLQGLIHGCSLLIHKSHFDRVGVFDENLITTQDYDLWFRIMRSQNTIYIAEPLVLARIHNSQGSRILECHNTERCQLHIGFLKDLTEQEMSSIYGSPYNFYHRMCCFFKGGKMKEAYMYANEKLQEASIPDNITEQLSKLDRYIKSLSKNKANHICIFGAGEYGIRLYQELRSKLISVDFFSDNNSEKWGYIFDNIYCITPDQLKEKKEDTLVIIANRTPTEIIKQLKSEKFPYITTKQEIDGELFNVPPVKWITALENIESLDYSSPETLTLINIFNQTIFDICKYYEDKLNKNKIV